MPLAQSSASRLPANGSVDGEYGSLDWYTEGSMSSVASVATMSGLRPLISLRAAGRSFRSTCLTSLCLRSEPRSMS